MTKLIIAEKPSVATDIARVLGGMKKKGDYYEGGDWIVANALGHLLELSCPEKYEVKRGKWTFGHLPVLPPTSYPFMRTFVPVPDSTTPNIYS